MTPYEFLDEHFGLRGKLSKPGSNSERPKQNWVLPVRSQFRNLFLAIKFPVQMWVL